MFGWGTGGHVPLMFWRVGDKGHFVPPMFHKARLVTKCINADKTDENPLLSKMAPRTPASCGSAHHVSLVSPPPDLVANKALGG